VIEIASGHIASTAPASAFFQRWVDMPSRPEWNLDTQWVRLDGPFREGVTGTRKSKNGPKVRFKVGSLIPDRRFVDVSHLIGTRLTFANDVTPAPGGGCTVDVHFSMRGPLAWFWRRLLSQGLRTSVQPDLERLARLAEGAPARST
jgi:hypothetical protein